MKKVMLIGLDGTSWKLLNPWIARGKLPTIAKILNQGSYGTLLSTIPCQTSPALPAFYTGKNPGALGVFGFTFSDGSLTGAGDIEYKAIWEILGELGHKSCVMNLSTIYPPQPFNGVMVSGACPYKDSQYTYPKEIQVKTQGFHIGKHVLKEIWTRLHHGELSAIDDIKALVQRRYQIFKEIAQEDAFDFLLLWISQTDIIQHFCWDYPELMLDLFKEIDKILSDILTSFPEYILLIMSDHGFDGYYDRPFYVNTWLMQQGYLKMKGGYLGSRIWPVAYALTEAPLVRQKLFPLWKWLSSLRKRKTQSKSQTRLAHSFYRALPGIDWEKSIAFLDQDWGIRILTENIAPGKYDQIATEIVEQLRGLQDKHGNNVIKGLWRREDLYSGKYVKEIPDIVFLSTHGYVAKCPVRKEIFPDRRLTPELSSHTFARDGMLAAYGPGIIRGQHVVDVEILDLAPTILHIMGIDIPREMDGKVMTQLFEIGSEVSQEIRYQDLDLTKEETPSEALPEQEIQALKDRLRGLGYID